MQEDMQVSNDNTLVWPMLCKSVKALGIKYIVNVLLNNICIMHVNNSVMKAMSVGYCIFFYKCYSHVRIIGLISCTSFADTATTKITTMNYDPFFFHHPPPPFYRNFWTGWVKQITQVFSIQPTSILFLCRFLSYNQQISCPV